MAVLAAIATLLFLVAFIIELVGASSLVMLFLLAGLTLLAAHHAFGDRVAGNRRV